MKQILVGLFSVITVLLAGFVIFALLVGVQWVAEGLAISYMWDWFVVPIFAVINIALPAISILHGVGISMLVGLMAMSTDHETWNLGGFSDGTDEEKQEVAWVTLKKILTNIMRPLLVLFSGWIVSMFM